MSAEIRVGKVSSIDYPSGMVRVTYPDMDDDVTRLIPLFSSEYAMPPVGALVAGQSSSAPVSMRLLTSYGMEYAVATFKPYRHLFPEPYLIKLETDIILFKI